jgi:tetratricopeptide (TPR) repeat protein
LKKISLFIFVIKEIKVPKAEKVYENSEYTSSIKLDEFLKQTQKIASNQPSEIKEDNTALKSYINILAKQTQKLLTTTERLLHRNEYKKNNYWNFLILSVISIITISGITYFIINKNQAQIKQEVTNNLETKFSSLENLITKGISDTNKKEKKSYLTERTYIMNRLNEIEKNISTQDKKQNKILDAHEEKLEKILSYLEKITAPKQIKKIQEATTAIPLTIVTKAPQITNEQSNAIASLLDKIQTKKIEKNIIFANAHAKKAWEFSQKHEYEQAIQEYSKAIELNPKFGMAYYNIACSYAKLENTTVALGWLKKGRPYFTKNIIETAKYDPDLSELRKNPYFLFLMFGN